MYIYKDVKVNYQILGESGEWIVFLHGWGGSTASFFSVANTFKEKNRCLLIDMPPHGNSSEPENPIDLNFYVELLKDLLNYLDIKKIHIISHSFGGRVAICFSCLYNQSVDKLVLIDSAGIKPRRGLLYFFKILRYKYLKKIKSKKINKCGSEDYRALSPTMKKTFINIVNQDLSNNCKLIKSKTLLIYGKKDKATPIYMAKKINRLIKDSELIIYKNSGHFSYIEEFSRTIIILDYFLRS